MSPNLRGTEVPGTGKKDHRAQADLRADPQAAAAVFHRPDHEIGCIALGRLGAIPKSSENEPSSAVMDLSARASGEKGVAGIIGGLGLEA